MSQKYSRAKFYAAGDLRVTSDMGIKGQMGKIFPTALSYCPRAWSSAIDQGIDPVQPKEQTKAQRRAITGCCRNPQGFPSLHLKVMPGKGQSSTVSLKKRRDYRRGVFSLETGRLTGPETGILLLVKTKSRSNWLFSVTTTPRAQSLPPRTLLSFMLLLLNPTGDRILSQSCMALPSQAVPAATPGSEL